MNTLTYAVPNHEDEYPILRPGECFKDIVHQDWHFCTPDGTKFCILGTYVHIGRTGLTIYEDKMPTHANQKWGKCVENRWTVVEDEWVKRERFPCTVD